MAMLNDVESKLSPMFKGLPPLPESAKESLVKFWPWLALIFGILQLIAAWALYGLVRITNVLTDYANTLSVYYTGKKVGPSGFDKTLIYLGILVLIVDAVILLMAYAPLKARSMKGWDLIFLGALVNVLYSVVTLFISGRGVVSFITSLIGSAIGFYLLFQIKDKFGKKSEPTPPAVSQ